MKPDRLLAHRLRKHWQTGLPGRIDCGHAKNKIVLGNPFERESSHVAYILAELPLGRARFAPLNPVSGSRFTF